MAEERKTLSDEEIVSTTPTDEEARGSAQETDQDDVDDADVDVDSDDADADPVDPS